MMFNIFGDLSKFMHDKIPYSFVYTLLKQQNYFSAYLLIENDLREDEPSRGHNLLFRCHQAFEREPYRLLYSNDCYYQRTAKSIFKSLIDDATFLLREERKEGKLSCFDVKELDAPWLKQILEKW